VTLVSASLDEGRSTVRGSAVSAVIRKGVPLAKDPTETIGIIGALSNAGLLGAASSDPLASPRASEAVRVIGALREAGVLGIETVDPAPPPDPPQGPQAGDVVWVYFIRHTNMALDADGNKEIEFQAPQVGGGWWQVKCAFPPNDDRWLTEIERVFASPKPSGLTVQVEVTSRPVSFPGTMVFSAELKYLRAGYRTPPLPASTNSYT
jgi:hypothetical protein